MTSIVI